MSVFNLSAQAFNGYISTWTHTPRFIHYADVSGFFEIFHPHILNLLTVAQSLYKHMR